MQTITTNLIQQLRRYRNKFADEPSVEPFLDLLQSQPNSFSRTCYADGHITASAWVVNQNWDKCLLTQHQKLQKWLQLGGHLEDDESPLAAAIREANEESGLPMTVLNSEIFDLDIHEIPAIGIEPKHFHYDVRYILTARDDLPLLVSNPGTDPVSWVSLTNIARYTKEESIHRMVKKLTRVPREQSNKASSRGSNSFPLPVTQSKHP